MSAKHIFDVMRGIANAYDDGTPGPKVMIVPHIIPVDCKVIPGGASITYQMEIPLADVPDGFLLTGIHSRYEIQHLRIRKGTLLYFSSPGWFIHSFHDHKIEPPLFIQAKDSGWYMDVLHKPNTFHQPEKLEFALIGQRVVPL